jgi:predicted amidohydrolase
MKVAGLQIDIAWEDPETSFSRVVPLAQQAAASGARLLVLPEMFATGFSMDAERMAARHGEIGRFATALAKNLGVWLVAGWAEPASPQPANSCRLIDPAGVERLVYRKIHPFSLAGEAGSYQAGDEVVTFEVEGLRVTPLICYDLRFPELFRLAADRTDLFVVPANWPDRRIHAWRALLAARALDAQCYVLGVNRVGIDGHGAVHPGASALVDPLGQVVASLSDEVGVVIGAVDVGRVAEIRDRYHFLDDRRPDLYRRLEDEGASRR